LLLAASIGRSALVHGPELVSATTTEQASCATCSPVSQQGQGLLRTFTRLIASAEHCLMPASEPVVASNRPPITQPDYFKTRPGQGIMVDVLANDRDPEGGHLYIGAITRPVNGSIERLLSAMEISIPENVVYTPRAGYQGLDFFHYNVVDMKQASTREIARVQVGDWVGPANWPTSGHSIRPPVAVDDRATTRPATSVSINVLANDRDPDGEPLVLLGFMQARNGTVTFDRNRPGMLIYTPRAGFTGEDCFEYTMADGSMNTAKAQVKIKVEAPTNRPPIALDDRATTRPGKAVTINVLSNDRDPDGDALTIVRVTQPSKGSVRIDNGRVVYTPREVCAGTDRFTYTIRDAKGAESTANVIVRMDNQPPIANPDFARLRPHQTLTIDVLANDRDPDGDTIRLVDFHSTTQRGGHVRRDPMNLSRLIYTPPREARGIDYFTYTISDGHGGRAEGRVTLLLGPQPCVIPAILTRWLS
jgi:hypothetical protein